MVFYAIIGLVFILLIVFSVMSAKDWHWVNIVFLVLTYLAGVAATIALGQVFDQRNAAMKKAIDAKDNMVKQERLADIALNGAPNATEYDPDSLQGVNQLLNLKMMGRGRVWSGGTITIEDPVRVFTFPAALPAVENQNQSLEDVELFAFKQDPTTGYPVSFIGKVRVTEQSPEALRVEDVFISDGREFLTPSGKWSLFEKMPIDRHGSFRAVTDMTDKDNFDLTKFRQILETNFLTPEIVNLPADSEAYEKLVDDFAFDGLTIGEIKNWIESQPNRQSRVFEPALEEVMVKYEFNKESNRSYAVDFNDGNLDTDGPFTPLGLAVDPTLHIGKEVKFAKGDTITVDQNTANGYQRADGTKVAPFADTENVSEAGRYFIRKLRDYPFELADLQTRAERLDREMIRLQDNNVTQDNALVDTAAQLAERSRLKVAIDQDNAKLQNDLDSINALASVRQKEVADDAEMSKALQEQIDSARQVLEGQSRVLINAQ